MSLSDVTDPRAVDLALAEFDRLDRDAFLKKYKFGRSRAYYVVHEGRLYDSKAILAAAHGYQFPDRGPLRAAQFNGGEASTAPRLRSLGFYVTGGSAGSDARTSPETRRYWALLANPATYDVEAALAAGTVESWSSKDRPIRSGDGVILWRSRGRDGRRGIVAIGEVTGDAFVSSDEDDPFWMDREAAVAEEARVPVRFYPAPGLPQWIDGPNAELLESLRVARARGGTVFQVSPEEWARISEVAGVRTELLDEVDEVASPLRWGGGQGRGLGAAERRAVELRAMELAIAHYAQRWETVDDVASTRSYDLECRSGDRYLRVEVKGTTGRGDSVLLTANEVTHAGAQAPHVALFVVSGIQLRREPGSDPVASGGSVRIFEPWEVDACTLRPVAYECGLPAR
ncbi:MAG TPA: EVE domain-containing protein [Longimicrobium sp.]|nr:EVE domain-containing protein [Longimicrobium sp.]